MFDKSIFGDLAESSLFDEPTLADIICEPSEPKDEDICKIKIPDYGRGFVFYPSHLKTYIMLKGTDPQLATLFIEELLNYGITGEHISKNPIVRALMENIAPVIDSQYAKYLENCARDRHHLEYYNHPEDRYRGSFDKLMENAMKGVGL